MAHTVRAIDRAAQTARSWITEVAGEFGTADRDFAFRVTRAWLRLVRDRLPVEDAVHLGAQLPELLRGVYYAGWDPAAVPATYGRQEFIDRFAADSGIARRDVPTSSRSVCAAFDRHLSGRLGPVRERLPAELRDLIAPKTEPARERPHSISVSNGLDVEDHPWFEWA